MQIMEFNPMAVASLCQTGGYGSRKFVTRDHKGERVGGGSRRGVLRPPSMCQTSWVSRSIRYGLC